jgi:hypothetical protein
VNNKTKTTKAVQNEKFSQTTRQARTVQRSKQKPLNQGVFDNSRDDRVTLVSKEKMSCRVDEKTLTAISFPDQIAGLSKMDLRRRYSAEENTHRNMLSRQKTTGAVIHPDFRTFASFISIVGPMPARGATLDRIDNTDPEYGPGKVRWADKRTQNNNKSDTHIFHYSRTGDTYTVSRLAKLQHVVPSTIRKRLERGWSDDEIIEGKHSTPSPLHHHASVAVAPKKRTSPASAKSAKEIAFERNAEYYRWYREKYGAEAIQAPLEVVNEVFGPDIVITPEQYERKFRSDWPEDRPHVIFSNLPVSQQELIAKIDPEYVRGLSAQIAGKSKNQDEI